MVVARLFEMSMLISICALAAAACGGGEEPVGPAEVACPVGVDCLIGVPPVTVLIAAAAIPAGGLMVTVTHSTGAPVSPTLVPGSAWEIQPSGTAFDPPAQVTIDYSGLSLQSLAGVLPAELGIYKVVAEGDRYGGGHHGESRDSIDLVAQHVWRPRGAGRERCCHAGERHAGPWRHGAADCGGPRR